MLSSHLPHRWGHWGRVLSSFSQGCTLGSQDLKPGSMVSHYALGAIALYLLTPATLGNSTVPSFQSACLSLGSSSHSHAHTAWLVCEPGCVGLPAKAQSQKSTQDKMPGPGFLGSLSVLTSRPIVPRLNCPKFSCLSPLLSNLLPWNYLKLIFTNTYMTEKSLKYYSVLHSP